MRLSLSLFTVAVLTPGLAANQEVAPQSGCADFASQREAQARFEAEGGPELDALGLDLDRDGFACEEVFGSYEDAPAFVRFEIYVVRRRGDGTEQLVPATRARSGEILEYRLIVTNATEFELAEGIVQVLGVVPEGTTFVPESATPTSERILVEFSGDGGTTFAGAENLTVEPEAYSRVRWTLQVPLGPNDQESFSYRVKKE